MPDLLVEKQGHTTILTLNRPGKHNAFNQLMRTELAGALEEFQADPNQYVAIITGAGDKAFCAGADLGGMADAARSGTVLPISQSPDIAGIAACEKVTIAAINGFAVAGGVEIAISCDIRIASDTAWFGLFEVKRGILAGVACNVLPRLMPMGAVLDLMLSADRLPAEDAHRLGLIQQVRPQEEVLATALEKAEMIAQNSQAAVWGTKKVLKYWRDALIADQQKYYEAVMHRVLLSGDVHEGPRAFVEKREPHFSNRWPDPFLDAP